MGRKGQKGGQKGRKDRHLRAVRTKGWKTGLSGRNPDVWSPYAQLFLLLQIVYCSCKSFFASANRFLWLLIIIDPNLTSYICGRWYAFVDPGMHLWIAVRICGLYTFVNRTHLRIVVRICGSWYAFLDCTHFWIVLCICESCCAFVDRAVHLWIVLIICE